jgi:hypothetical protein
MDRLSAYYRLQTQVEVLRLQLDNIEKQIEIKLSEYYTEFEIQYLLRQQEKLEVTYYAAVDKLNEFNYWFDEQEPTEEQKSNKEIT